MINPAPVPTFEFVFVKDFDEDVDSIKQAINIRRKMIPFGFCDVSMTLVFLYVALQYVNRPILTNVESKKME